MKATTLLMMIPFEIERALCSKINRALGRRPSSAPFLSGDTYRAMADAIFDETTSCDPSSIKDGSVVFVAAKRLGEFSERVLPRVRGRFVLVSHQGDEIIGESYEPIADHPMVLRWFAQNCELEHPKATPLPIGLEDRWRHNNGELSDFRRIAKSNRPGIPRIAFGFTIGTNLESRLPCYASLKRCAAADELPQPLNSSLYREAVRKYMLVASPPGNGPDCHRTWESVYMRSVPIVEDSYMSRRFKDEGLPLVLVRSWEDVRGWDEERVRRTYEAVSAESDWDAAFLEHWSRKIASSAKADA